MKIVITGGPLTGKTTLAELMRGEGSRVRAMYSTDIFKHMSWSDQSLEVARMFSDKELGVPPDVDDWIVEGTAAVRGLRKWMSLKSRGRPCDVVVYLTQQFGEPNSGHRSMKKGCDTIFSEITPNLLARGVRVLRY